MRPIPDAPPIPKVDFDRYIEEMKKDVDRTLIRENLKRTVEERLVALMKLQEFAEELRRAGGAVFGR